MAWWQWSKTAASNATADSTINWSEGQSPSSVNDSARAMMARAAEYRDDISGLLDTAGTTTAYTVTTNQGLASTPTHGQLISITPHFTNGASPTLAADGGTAFPIQSAAGSAVAAGVLIAGSPYDLKFDSFASAWRLKNFFANPFNVPLGTVLDYTGTVAPNSNFALANGQAISRTTYAAYFALVGTTFGPGDGSTTFNIPDLSNRVVAGLQMGGSARITVAGGNFDGNALGAAGGAQNHTLTTAQIPSHSHTGTTDGSTVSGTTASSGSHDHGGSTGNASNDHTHPYATAANKTGALGTGPGAPLINIWNGVDTSVASGGQSSSHSHTISSDGAHTHTFNAGSHAHTFTTGATGSGGSHPIMPPTMVLSKIVRIF